MIRKFIFATIIGAFLWVMGLSLNGCNQQKCVSNGFIAQVDTVLHCKCGDFELHALDTFVMKQGNCMVNKFQSRKLADWIDDNGVLRIGMEPDAPPTYFTDGDKETGFDYQLLKAIFPKVFPGVDMEVKGYTYDTLYQLMMQPNPQIEIIAGGYVADSNLKNVMWTKPYITFGYSLLTKEENQGVLKDLASLAGKRVGVYDDGITEEWVKKNVPNVGEIVKGMDNPDSPESDWMRMLIEGKVDAIVYDYPFAVQEIVDYEDMIVIANKRLNLPNDLKGYSFGIPAGNKKLLRQLNEAIDAFKNTQEYAKMVAFFIPDPDVSRAVASTNMSTVSPATTPSPPAKNTEAVVKKETPKKPKIDMSPDKVIAQTKEKEAKIEGYSGNVHKVQQGETLAIIAQKVLGDVDRWEEIYILNPHVVSPDIVYSGTLLKLPEVKKNKEEPKEVKEPTETKE